MGTRMGARMGTTSNVAGMTPEEWETRLETAASSETLLQQVLAELEREIGQERTWLHDNPSPAGVLVAVLEFFGQPLDTDLAALGSRIKAELQRERRLRKRYRSWHQGETWGDRLAPYLKGFAGEVGVANDGLQFPGFTKYVGIAGGSIVSFWLSRRFPGRDPANFHVTSDAKDGTVVLKRIYRMELPTIDRVTTVGRAILAEMIRALVSDLRTIRRLVIDNAANTETRSALLNSRRGDGGVTLEAVRGADASRTLLGHLMIRLAEELGMIPGKLVFAVLPFGMLRLELPVSPS